MAIKPRNFFDGRICCRCGNSKTTQGFGSPRWHKYYNIYGNWDGRSYLCHKCYVKMKALCRNKGLSKDSNTGKGFICEQIFCKVRGIKNCNVEKDNFSYKQDAKDPEYGIVQVKSTSIYENRWTVRFGEEYHFDTLVILCMDKEMKNVERVYIIPEQELYPYIRIDIHFDFSKVKSKYGWVEKYRVCEKQYNDTYHVMRTDDCPVIK